MFKIKIQLKQSQLRDEAMLRVGVSPRGMSLKPGTRVETNRKSRMKRGYEKHKSNHLD